MQRCDRLNKPQPNHLSFRTALAVRNLQYWFHEAGLQIPRTLKVIGMTTGKGHALFFDVTA